MTWLVIPAVVCLCSFAWAMQCHFVRAGRFTPGMTITALAGLVSSAVQIVGLVLHADGFPGVSLALYALSAALFWSAIRATAGAGLAACFQGQTPRRIVRSGPYRWIRHPFYTSYSLTWLAGFAATLWWPAAVALGGMIALYVRAARGEELDWLGGSQWEEYASYIRETGGLLPRFGRFKI